MQIIPTNNFLVKINNLWANQGLLLTCGDYQAEHYNTMTVGWGYFGIMWGKPAAAVVVRPTRYTYEFMNRYDTFTLCAFPPTYKNDLQLLGSKSGRDGDKIAETGLHITPAVKVSAPCFIEAELVIECQIMYRDDLNPDNFLDKSIYNQYPGKDYHRLYFGKILEIRGICEYNG